MTDFPVFPKVIDKGQSLNKCLSCSGWKEVDGKWALHLTFLFQIIYSVKYVFLSFVSSILCVLH